MLKKHSNKGFSLIELIIAVAVLSIVAAFFIPSFLHMIDETRMEKDLAKFESMSIAFKRSMSDPAVIKAAEELNVGEIYVVAFYIDENGYIDFTKGEITGTDDAFTETQLWLNAYQMIGMNYQSDYKAYREKYLVFCITPKQHNTTAMCTYELRDTW